MYLMHFIKTIKDFATTKDLIAEFSYPIGLDIENPYVIRFKRMDTDEPLASYAVDYKTFNSHASTDAAINELIKRVEEDLRPAEEEESDCYCLYGSLGWLFASVCQRAAEYNYNAWITTTDSRHIDIKFVPKFAAPCRLYAVTLEASDTIDDIGKALDEIFEDLCDRTEHYYPRRHPGVPYRRYQ